MANGERFKQWGIEDTNKPKAKKDDKAEDKSPLEKIKEDKPSA